MINMESKICVIGWYFFENFYDEVKKKSKDTHIVAHRYNKILDELKLDYSVIKNIGLEFGAYDYYIKNVWDGKSNVLFMHDDIYLKNKFSFNDMFSFCKGLDHVSFRNNSISSGGGRCLYLSAKIINLFLKEFGGIWFDKNDRGYTFGKLYFYDDIYYSIGEKKIWKDKIGINFKMTLAYFIKKYKIKSKDILYNKIDLCVRGSKKGKFSKMIKSGVLKLNDNSLFGIRISDVLDKKDKNRCMKWYDFYLSNIKNENMNVLEIGINNVNSLKIWERYLPNSTLYGITKNKIENTKNKIFVNKELNNNDLEKINNKIPYGIDIIIDTGEYDKNRINNFEFLFSKLNAGGIYAIEDLRKSYKNKNNDIINYFKEKIDIMNFYGDFEDESYEDIIYKRNKEIGFFEKRIASIHFYLGMCFVFKRYCK